MTNMKSISKNYFPWARNTAHGAQLVSVEVTTFVSVGNNIVIKHMVAAGSDRFRSSRAGIIVWHDDVIKWKYFPRYFPFVLEIHCSPVNSPHKVQ